MTRDTGKLIRNSTVDFLIFTLESGEGSIEVRYEDETIWMSQKMMALLFDVTQPTISEHLISIFESGELNRETTYRKFRLVQREGNRDVSRNHRRIAMTMEDWASRLDQFLTFDDREILTGPGNVSTDQAKKYVKCEFEKFRLIQDRAFESDFDRLLKESEKRNPHKGDDEPGRRSS